MGVVRRCANWRQIAFGKSSFRFLVGSELPQISSLDRESLLKMVILSFVANSRQQNVCKNLTIVVHRRDYERIDMLEVRAFRHTVGHGAR